MNDKRLSAYTNMSGKATPSSVNPSSPDPSLFKVPAPNKPEGGKESVYRRVAKFLLIIGIDEAAKVLQHLPQEQTEKIVPELASIRSVRDEEKAVILAEFEGLITKKTENGGKETARTILEKAWGPEKAEQLLSKAAPYVGGKPFEYLNSEDIEKVFLLLNDESVGVQSLVLSHIEPKKAAAVINKMAPEAKKEVVIHLASSGAVSPEVIRRVDQAMHEKAQSIQVEKAERMDGRNALSEILKKMSPGSEEGILKVISDEDPELGRDLRDRLFTTDDVLNVDERFIQEYLRSLSDMDVVYLIAGKPGMYRKKILDCVSAGRKAQVLEEEELNKPVRKSDCDEATSRFIAVMREAYEHGHLVIRGRNDGDFVS